MDAVSFEIRYFLNNLSRACSEGRSFTVSPRKGIDFARQARVSKRKARLIVRNASREDVLMRDPRAAVSCPLTSRRCADDGNSKVKMS